MSNTWSSISNLLKREKLLFSLNIVVLTVTFLLLGTLVSLIVFGRATLKSLESQAQITIFFKDDFGEENILNLQTRLEGDERIQAVKYISKEEAYKIFAELNKDEPLLLDSISADILPASLEIRANNIKNLEPLSEEFKAIDGVEEVKFFKDVVDRFKTFTNVLYIVGLSLVGVFILISFAVISTTIRTAITAKGEEIAIQHLVGASESYIKTPLIFQGMFFGLVTAFLASILLNAAFLFLHFGVNLFGKGALFSIGDLRINTVAYGVILSFLLILSGWVLGTLSSYFAVKKYLRR